MSWCLLIVCRATAAQYSVSLPMSLSRPIEFLLSSTEAARPLLEWLALTGEFAVVSHAPGKRDRNLQLQSDAIQVMKGEGASRQSLRSYNELLLQQRWQADDSFSRLEPGDILLWHTPSCTITTTNTSVRGPERLPVEAPFSGWFDGNSGTSRDWPTCANRPGFLHFKYLLEGTGNPIWGGVSFIATCHGRSEAAPDPLKRAWARLKRFAKAQYHCGAAS